MPTGPSVFPHHFEGSFAELKERQLVLALTRELAEAQFVRGDRLCSEPPGRRLRQRRWTLSGPSPCFAGFMTTKTALLSVRWIALVARSVVRLTAGSAHHSAVWQGFVVAFDQALVMVRMPTAPITGHH